MNEQNETTINPMQATEAFPVEEQSLPAEVVLAEQQAGFLEPSDTPPVYVP